MKENKELVLHTEALILREFIEDDWLAVQEYGSDPEVVKFLPFGPNTEQDTKEFMNKVLAQKEEQPRLSYNLAIVSKIANKLIGSYRIQAATENKQGNIGYVLNQSFWNQGYMTEATRRVLRFGFEKLGLHRIFATCDPANIGSYRVMEKSGMQREGHLREHKLMKGRWRDSLIYSILEPEWRANETLMRKANSANANELKIEYAALSPFDLEEIRTLWEKLFAHHQAVSRYFKERLTEVNFDIRKRQLLEKSTRGSLHITLAEDPNTGKVIGYCVTSLTAEKQGEIESIYVEPDYRRSGVGNNLMTGALGWLESNLVKKTILGVGEGNESVFEFYLRYRFYPRTTILERKTADSKITGVSPKEVSK